jgi:hypothetical protein
VLGLLTTLVTATPSPSPTSRVPDELVTPGVWGFVITFALVIGVVLLIVDMVRRVRRVTYRAAVSEQLDAEQAAAAETGDDPPAS